MSIGISAAAPAVQGGGRTISLEEQFANFYQEQQNELLDSVQEGLVKKIVEQQSRSGDYVSEVSDIPEADSKELLDYLFSKTEEEDA